MGLQVHQVEEAGQEHHLVQEEEGAEVGEHHQDQVEEVEEEVHHLVLEEVGEEVGLLPPLVLVEWQQVDWLTVKYNNTALVSIFNQYHVITQNCYTCYVHVPLLWVVLFPVPSEFSHCQKQPVFL